MPATTSTCLRATLALFPALLLVGCSDGGGRRKLNKINVVPPAFTQITLEGRTDIASGTSATNAAIADVDGDGINDLIVARFTDSRVTWFRALGNGSFGPGNDLPVGPLFPIGLAVTPVDGDSLPDVVVTDFHNDSVFLYRNLGGGAFSAPVQLATGDAPIAVVVTDFDDDGFRDLAVAAIDSLEVRVHIGNAAFTFTDEVSIPVGGRPVGLAAAQLSGSSHPDLIVTDLQENLVRLFEFEPGTGNQSGFQFTETFTAQPQGQPIGVALANLDGSGLPEIVLGVVGSAFVEIWKDNGSGYQLFSSVNMLSSSTGVAVADINGDGKLDLVAGLPAIDAVGIAFGNGDGTFGPAEFRTTGRFPVFVAAGDVTGDPFAEAVGASSGTPDLTVHAGKASGIGGPGAFFAGFSPQFMSAADLNADARPDLIAGDSQTGQVNFLRNEPGLKFSLVPGSTLQTPSSSAKSQITIDIDRDGDEDLVALHTGGLTIYKNVGNLVFQNDGSLSVNGDLLDGVAVDVNRDGRLDIVASNPQQGQLMVFRNTGTTLVLFETIPVGGTPSGIDAADLDNDGDLDLAAADSTGNRVTICRRKPVGTFLANAAQLETRGEPGYVHLSDLDGDGRADLVVSHTQGDDLLVFHNDGKLQFSEQTPTPTGGRPLTSLVVDVDVNGLEDVLYVENTTGRARIRLTQLDGTFGPVIASFSAQYLTTSAVFLDLDGDNKPEFVTASAASTLFEVHKNSSQ
ncbi:MAG: VCBS repeat-containing protein [Planctomycetes bacterium]|nr:VCBS repeat-containing protein [Planctomycetota bacterium]